VDRLVDRLMDGLAESNTSLFAKFTFMYLIDTLFYVKMLIAYCFPAKVLIPTRSSNLLWQELLRG
jgi:hypothetical protein